jgi:hypothetical protein
MNLNFPNHSRSYDESHKCVRFWGHDGTFEIPFFVDLDALAKLQKLPQLDELTILDSFDRWRARIIGVASSVYRSNRRPSHRLVAADF